MAPFNPFEFKTSLDAIFAAAAQPIKPHDDGSEIIDSDEESLFSSDDEEEDLPIDVVISNNELAADDDATKVSIITEAEPMEAMNIRGGDDTAGGAGAAGGAGGNDPNAAGGAGGGGAGGGGAGGGWPNDFPDGGVERVAAQLWIDGWPYITQEVAIALVREGLVFDKEMRSLNAASIDAIIRNLNRTYNLTVGHKLKTDLTRLCFTMMVYYMSQADRLTANLSPAMTTPYDALITTFYSTNSRPAYQPGTTNVPKFTDKRGQKSARRILKDITLLLDQLYCEAEGGVRIPLSVVVREHLIPGTVAAGRRGPSTASVHDEIRDRFPAFTRDAIDPNANEFKDKTEVELASLTDEVNFNQASRIVYSILLESFGDSALWHQIEGACENGRSGRLAYSLLMKAAMGKEYYTREKEEITKNLNTNNFRGTLVNYSITTHNSRQMSLIHRMRLLQKESDGKVSCMTEPEEVDVYLKSITCGALKTTKQIIMSNSAKRMSVEACMDDVAEAVRTLGRDAEATNRSSAQRHIQLIRGGGGNPRGEGRDRVATWDEAAVSSQMADLKRRYFNPEHKGFVPSKVYKSLDANGLQAVYRLRKAAGFSKNGSSMERTIKAMEAKLNEQARELAAMKKQQGDAMDTDENDDSRANPTGGGRNPRNPKK